MKPKLLVVTSTFPRWSNDTDPPFVYELSRRLTDSFDVTVHTPHYPGSRTSEQMGGMHIHRFRYFFAPYERLAGGQGIVSKMRRNKLYSLLLPFFLFSQFFSLILLVSKLHPDLIHAHWLIPQGFWAVVAKKLFKIPVIITAHGADVFSLRTPAVIRAKQWIVKNADRIVTVSSALADVLRADTQCPLRPDIIPMGVDASLFCSEKMSRSIRGQYGINGPFLLFVGRLTEKKGVGYLIDAMSMVIKDFPSAKLLIIGHGELEQELLEQVKLRDLEDIVLFAGGIANAQLPSYYATADLFIGPSVQVKFGDSEGFGVTFVEAAMSSFLVIGTTVGGIEDIIKDGVTGYLVPPGDSNALAAKIVEVLADLNNHENMEKEARNEATVKFDWSLIAARYRDAYLSHL
ncbi:MAG: glycosyltransferase [Desulfobulbus sp.]|nr:glycosyltransferase [Desulfobulbus sp.]